MQADDVCLHWSFLQFHVLNLVFHRICKRFSNSLAASSQRYRIYPNTQDTLDFFRLCVCVCWALLNVGLKCHKNAKAYKCNARTTHTLIHSLAHSFIPALTHTPHANHLHTWAANGLFSHFSKGTVALKGNLLCFFALFAERISFFLQQNTAHNAVHDHGAYCVRKRHIFPVPWAAHLHSHIHTHTHARTYKLRHAASAKNVLNHNPKTTHWGAFKLISFWTCASAIVCVCAMGVCVCVCAAYACQQ